MAEFQYTTVPGKIGPLFEKVRNVGIPPKATLQWLKSLGFTSSNDASLLPVLKAAGFADSNGAPNETWKQYRGAHHKTVMAAALRKAYSALFEMYSDAATRSDKDLTHFFSTRSSSGAQAISKTIATFKNLAVLADFSAQADNSPDANSDDPKPNERGSQLGVKANRPGQFAALHIDVQIHIAADAPADQIDQIFASMAKHLYGNN